MENKECLSVSQFSSLAGVSKQAIYKQAKNENSQLSPYFVKKGNNLFILASALWEVYGLDNPELNLNNEIQPDSSTYSTEKQPTETTKTTQEDNQNQPLEEDYIALLKGQIQELKEERQRLNEAISEKDKTIKEQSQQIADLAQQITDIAKGALITASRQQLLNVGEQEPQEEEPPVVVEPEPEGKKPRSFWKRLFNIQ